MPQPHFRVTLAFDPQGKNYLTQVASGIYQQSQAQPEIEYVVSYPWFSERSAVPLEQVGMPADGTITGVRWHSLPRLKQKQQPTISVGPEGLLLEEFPWVGPDYAAVARLACEFFAARGYRRIEYFHCGGVYSPHSKILRDACQDTADLLGLECSMFQMDIHHNDPQSPTLYEQIKALANYLKNTPRPCAVFTMDDHHAWRVSEACRIAGLNIPREVSILGVRSDDYLCEFAKPALSHIHIDYQEIGRVAAQQIERYILGEQPPRHILTQGFQVRERASSSMTAHHNPVVETAVHFMQANLHDSITVDAIAKAAHVSRRTLIRRFTDILGKPPTEVLREMRIDLAKKLLSNTELPLIEVTLRCGLSDQSQLSRMIRDATGKTPAALRREYRLS